MASLARLATAPGALLLGGLVLWGMAWAIDFWVHYQVIAANPTLHNHGGGDAIIRINFPMTGFPLIVFGVWQLMGSENLVKRPGFLAFVGGILMAVDGLAHGFAFNDHMNEYSAPFFAAVAPAQIAVGVALPFLARRYDGYWILLSLALLGIYVVSRTVTIPSLALPEAADSLGIFSKFLEVAFVVVTLANMGDAPAPADSQERGGGNATPLPPAD